MFRLTLLNTNYGTLSGEMFIFPVAGKTVLNAHVQYTKSGEGGVSFGVKVNDQDSEIYSDLVDKKTAGSDVCTPVAFVRAATSNFVIKVDIPRGCSMLRLIPSSYSGEAMGLISVRGSVF